MKKKKRYFKIIATFLVVFCILSIFMYWGNNSIVISEYAYESNKIPASFDGYKILQISDLHNHEFGHNQSRLVEKIKKISPHIVVVTGDLIDSNHCNIEVAIELIKQISKMSTIYYVSGNHEAWSGKYDDLKGRLNNEGVIILDDASTKIIIGQEQINIIGVSDPAFSPSNYLDGTNITALSKCLTDHVSDGELDILLSHRPELMNIYKESNVDIVFSGHAHGGQFRLPWVGGLVAPDQGLFPEYDAGRYEENNTTMLVSRGLGNSIIPFRVFNRPELVVLTLNAQ